MELHDLNKNRNLKSIRLSHRIHHSKPTRSEDYFINVNPVKMYTLY